MEHMGQLEKNVAEICKHSGLVLFVDDEESIRTVGSKILERMGFDVISAENGQGGIDEYSNHFDQLVLVLFDFTMSDLDGDIVYTKMLERLCC